MDSFTLVDGGSAAILLISAILAYSRGLVREVLSIAGWVAAAVSAFIFAPSVEPLVREIPIISDIVGTRCELSIIAAFAAVFALTLAIVAIFTPLFSGIIQRSVLSSFDQSLGFLFGAMRGLILILVALVVYNFIGADLSMIENSKTKTILAGSETYIQTIIEQDGDAGQASLTSWMQNSMRIDESYDFFNPKVGVSYQLAPSSSLYASYARANREPSRSDFESNPDVKPEQLNDFEMGWRYSKEGVMLNINSYYMQYNEQLILTGALDDVGAPVRTNSGDSYRLGLEIEAAISLSEALTIQPALTLSSNKNKQTYSQVNGVLKDFGTTNISFSPEVVASNAFIYSPLKNFSLSFLTKYVGDQYMGNTDTETSKLDAYFVNDLNITYQWNP